MMVGLFSFRAWQTYHAVWNRTTTSRQWAWAWTRRTRVPTTTSTYEDVRRPRRRQCRWWPRWPRHLTAITGLWRPGKSKPTGWATASRAVAAEATRRASSGSASITRRSTAAPVACLWQWSATRFANCAALPVAAPCRSTWVVAATAAATAVKWTAATSLTLAGTSGSRSDNTWRSARWRLLTFLGFARCPSWLRHSRKRYDNNASGLFLLRLRPK